MTVFLECAPSSVTMRCHIEHSAGITVVSKKTNVANRQQAPTDADGDQSRLNVKVTDAREK